MMRKFLATISLVALASCSAEHRMADNKALCDPLTNEAYMVIPSLGDTSYVYRNKNLDQLCNDQN